jgi:hypothetical protein
MLKIHNCAFTAEIALFATEWRKFTVSFHCRIGRVSGCEHLSSVSRPQVRIFCLSVCYQKLQLQCTVKFAPVHTMKACRGSRGIATLLLNLGTRWTFWRGKKVPLHLVLDCPACSLVTDHSRGFQLQYTNSCHAYCAVRHVRAVCTKNYTWLVLMTNVFRCCCCIITSFSWSSLYQLPFTVQCSIHCSVLYT